MQQKTTQRPKRGGVKSKVARKELSMQQMLKKTAVSVLKQVLIRCLMRPAVWQWLMVKTPWAAESFVEFIKSAAHWMNPFD